jgi:hypothetical protein
MAKMIRRCLKSLWVWICLAILIGPGLQLLAEESDGEQLRNPYGARDPYENYPEEFSGRGILEALSSEAVVISDSRFTLDPGVSFHIPGRGLGGSPSSIIKGEAVAFIVNDQGQIVSLWKLNRMNDLMPK